jgi:hypothetical protein
MGGGWDTFDFQPAGPLYPGDLCRVFKPPPSDVRNSCILQQPDFEDNSPEAGQTTATLVIISSDPACEGNANLLSHLSTKPHDFVACVISILIHWPLGSSLD